MLTAAVSFHYYGFLSILNYEYFYIIFLLYLCLFKIFKNFKPLFLNVWNERERDISKLS